MKQGSQVSKCNNCKMLGVNPLCDGDNQSVEILTKTKSEFFLERRKKIRSTELKMDSIYIIREGLVKLTTTTENGKTLEVLYPGSFFGGHYYVGAGEMKFEIVAALDALICELPNNSVLLLLNSNPKIFSKYFATMSLYIASIRSEFANLNNVPLKSRLAKALHKDFKKRGQPFQGFLTMPKALSHEDWALLMGARRESVSRIFSELETSGIIRVEKDSLVLVRELDLLVFAANLKKTA